MKKLFSGWKTVFAFTAKSRMGKKGYIAATLVTSLVLLGLIPGLMVLTDKLVTAGQKPRATQIQHLALVDETGSDWQLFSANAGIYADIPLTAYPDAGSACASLGEADCAIVIRQTNGSLSVSAVHAEKSILKNDDCLGAAGAFADSLPMAIVAGSGLNPQQLMAAFTPIDTQIAATEMEESTPGGLAAELLVMLLPLAITLLVYFMVLIYANGAANVVITEKTSKLMDLMLVSIRPSAMMLGKLLAVTLAGILQFSCWVGSAIGGLRIGVWLVKTINPATTINLVVFFDFISEAGTLFSPWGIHMSILLVSAGFLLYCSMAAFGGAVAGKPEDLSSANMLYTGVFMVSYLVVLLGGRGQTNLLINTAPWTRYVPFTAILSQPGLLILGQTPVWIGAVSTAIVVLTALLFAALSGRAYTLCAFRKGSIKSPIAAIKMLFRSK